MNKKVFSIFFVVVAILVSIFAVWHLFEYVQGENSVLLNPQGLIALKERNLLVLVSALCMIVVIPVFILTIFVGWKYREGNTSAKYSPDWDNKITLEIIWWSIPSLLIIVFSVITWRSTHDLDPYRPIASTKQPIVIQVIAMEWKWLFIYPQQGIATVNFFQFPENTPIEFDITSDAPMNSFWIPALGSQIYAMPSMSTQLHLIARTTGTYAGSSANISGAGFSGMTFTAKSSTQADFDSWVQSVQQSPNQLTVDAYNSLAQQTSNNPISYYSWSDSSLYDKVLMKDSMQESSIATGTLEDNDMPGMIMK